MFWLMNFIPACLHNSELWRHVKRSPGVASLMFQLGLANNITLFSYSRDLITSVEVLNKYSVLLTLNRCNMNDLRDLRLMNTLQSLRSLILSSSSSQRRMLSTERSLNTVLFRRYAIAYEPGTKCLRVDKLSSSVYCKIDIQRPGTTRSGLTKPIIKEMTGVSKCSK